MAMRERAVHQNDNSMMAMRGSAVHKNNNHTLYIYSVISPYPFFRIVACPGHILKSTKGIEMKLG